MRKPPDLSVVKYAHTDTAYYDLCVSWQGVDDGLEAFRLLSALDIAGRKFRNGHAVVATLEHVQGAQVYPKQAAKAVGCILLTEANIGPRRFYQHRNPRPIIAAMALASEDALREFRRVEADGMPACQASLTQEIGFNLAHGLVNAGAQRFSPSREPQDRYGPHAWVDARCLMGQHDARAQSSVEVWAQLGLKDTLVDRAGKKREPTGDILMWYARNRLSDVQHGLGLRLAT